MVRGTLFGLAKVPTVATQPSLRQRIPVRIRSCPAPVCHSPVTSPTWSTGVTHSRGKGEYHGSDFAPRRPDDSSRRCAGWMRFPRIVIVAVHHDITAKLKKMGRWDMVAKVTEGENKAITPWFERRYGKTLDATK